MKKQVINFQNNSDPISVLFKEAVALYEEGNLEESADIYRKILETSPRHLYAWLNLGTTLRKLGHFSASAVCCERAIALKPDDAGFYTNFGNVLIDLDRNEQALAAHEKAALLDPKSYLVIRNHAIALRECGQFEKSLTVFEQAEKLNTKNENLEWEKAIALLHLARYKEGWRAFEARWKQPGMRERMSTRAKRWQGESVQGKTVLVYEEQGFGDSILCSRYIKRIAERGGKVMVEVKKPLHHLFSSLDGIVQIAEPGQIMDGFDYHVPMMSLPGIFNTDLANIPPPSNFKVLTAPPPEVQKALNIGKDKLKIGIVWSGSVTFTNNRKRAVHAERFLRLAEIPGVQLYSLQKGEREGELQACGASGIIPELGCHLNNFSETAATLKNLDLVIMTDSAVAHLAGSLGVPVWNLLHHRPYWLYLSDRTDTPWYPSMRLFRQKTPGDWDQVFEDVFKALTVLVSSDNGKRR